MRYCPAVITDDCLYDVIRINEQADEKLKKEKRKTDEARRYLHQKRDEEQAQFSDEDTDPVSHKPDATSTPINTRILPSVKEDVRIIFVTTQLYINSY